MEAIKKKQRFASTRYFGKLFYFLYHNYIYIYECYKIEITEATKQLSETKLITLRRSYFESKAC